ncbi:unnamed protein product [Rotaria sordida]|uniref:Uncharacterized protein n=1 Tax=Rotaria sordida TaxID=392033 RepID=A0A820FN75_9BILA|nr:unnamed protein product [Rotaria sordida]
MSRTIIFVVSSLVILVALSSSYAWNFGNMDQIAQSFIQQHGMQASGNGNGGQGKFAIGSCVSAASTGNYMACVGQLAHKIWTLHNWSEDTPITLCGMQCVGNLKGRISKLKWKWDAKFRCNGKAPGIEGHDTKQSRNGAMEWAIQDFLSKAFASGSISVEDFQC